MYRNGVWHILVREYFQQYVHHEATVIDLGAGYGEFINHIVCGKKYAMDLNPDTSEQVHSDVEVLLQDCSEPWPLSPHSVDVVFTSNFFEHLPDKATLAKTLDLAARYLRPGGKIIAMGPNIKYTAGAYWDFWDHHIALGEYALSEVLQQKGFVVDVAIDKFVPFTMVGTFQYPLFFTSLYLKLPFAWRIFGKQFLVVAHKE